MVFTQSSSCNVPEDKFGSFIVIVSIHFQVSVEMHNGSYQNSKTTTTIKNSSESQNHLYKGLKEIFLIPSFMVSDSSLAINCQESHDSQLKYGENVKKIILIPYNSCFFPLYSLLILILNLNSVNTTERFLQVTNLTNTNFSSLPPLLFLTMV